MIPVTRYNHKLLLYILAAGILSFLTSLVLMQVFFGLLVILWLTEKNSEKKKAFDTIGILLLIFLAVRLVSVFLSPYPEQSYQALYKDALFYLSFFSLNFYFKTFSTEERKRVIMFLVISAAVTALIGILRFNFGAVRRAESFTSGYTSYSAYLLAGTGIIMSFYKAFPNKKIILFSFIMALVYTGLITSLGRFNIIAAVLLFIAGIIIFRINYKAVLLILLLTSAFSFISFMNNSLEAELRIQQPSQLSDRDIIYEGAAAIWGERPLIGFGPRTFREIFPYRDKFADKGVSGWHNDFIQMYFESGVLGLAAFIVLIGYILLKGTLFIIRKKPENTYILYGIILALAGIILTSLTAGFINSPVLSVYFVLLTALLSAQANKNLLFKGYDNGN
jgi:O-antigen ligase